MLLKCLLLSFFFVSVVPPVGGALSLLKMHSVVVSSSEVLSVLNIHTVNADASYRTQKVTNDCEICYIICIVCCGLCKARLHIHGKLWADLSVGARSLSSVPLHRIIMFHKNGVQPFSNVPVSV